MDPEEARLQIAARLPMRVRWNLKGTPWDFDFSLSQHRLQPLISTDLNGCDIEKEWTDLYIFGTEDYAQGGGASPFLAVHRDTGQIFGLDVERESAQMYLLNSDVDRFIRTFLLFDGVLRLRTLPPAVAAERASAVDPDGFARSDWRGLANYLNSGE
jgi:hypothetical protein